MTFYQSERIALFIDGANLFSASKGLGVDIDYSKLLNEFKQKGRLLRANYYTALIEDAENYSPIRPLVDWLSYNGYRVVTKIAREYTDAQGRHRIKGDMDVEFTCDALHAASHVDHIILFTGDGDFTALIEAIKMKGVRVSLVSTTKTTPPMASDELRRACDNFIELEDIADIIGRDVLPDDD